MFGLNPVETAATTEHAVTFGFPEAHSKTNAPQVASIR
jgi:hypothetical protein